MTSATSSVTTAMRALLTGGAARGAGWPAQLLEAPTRQRAGRQSANDGGGRVGHQLRTRMMIDRERVDSAATHPTRSSGDRRLLQVGVASSAPPCPSAMQASSTGR